MRGADWILFERVNTRARVLQGCHPGLTELQILANKSEGKEPKLKGRKKKTSREK